VALSFSIPVVTASAANNGSSSFLPTSPQKDQLRPFFVYTLAPGATVHDTAELQNNTNKAIDYDLYTADATDVNGAFSTMGQSSPRKDVGAWVSVPTPTIRIKAHGKRIVNVQITVPANASPGDHAGAVVALGQVVGGGTSNQLQIGARYGVGVRIYLRVAGPTHAALSVTKINLSTPKGLDGALFGPARATATYTVENTGNLRLAPSSDVTISTRTKKINEPRADLGEMLPGSTITKTVKADGLRWSSLLGVVHAKVVVEAQGAPTTTETATVYTFPWLSLLILVALIALIIVARRLRRRLKRRKDASEPEPPTDAPTDELIGA
jgi:hypothetical protein